MFTGLIQKVGRLSGVERVAGGARLIVGHDPWDEVLVPGESVAVNGACLTVAGSGNESFTCDLLDETAGRTNLADKPLGAALNLERALSVGDRFGGHIVSGHIDGLGKLTERRRAGRDWVFAFACDAEIAAGIILKGSIACDGVSLTVTSIAGGIFEVNVIPFTLENSNLGGLAVGDTVNLETDLVGKYVRRYLGADGGESGLTMDRLRDAGFME